MSLQVLLTTGSLPFSGGSRPPGDHRTIGQLSLSMQKKVGQDRLENVNTRATLPGSPDSGLAGWGPLPPERQVETS
jgi:hypothetical protein